jgi:hypothetical protein
MAQQDSATDETADHDTKPRGRIVVCIFIKKINKKSCFPRILN